MSHFRVFRKTMRLLNTSLGILAGKRQGKFFHLFLCQLLLLIISPYLERRGVALVVYLVLGAAVFVSGVYAVSDRHAQWIAAVALAIPAGLMNAYAALQSDARIAVQALILTIVFLVFTLVSLLRAVLRDERVTHDTIYGALNVYLLMALGWSMAYLLLVTLQPHAFAALTGPTRVLSWFDCQYYSFVTLTTVGYGDIVPMTAQARSLSMIGSDERHDVCRHSYRPSGRCPLRTEIRNASRDRYFHQADSHQFRKAN
jgi:hypothetical protein